MVFWWTWFLWLWPLKMVLMVVSLLFSFFEFVGFHCFDCYDHCAVRFPGSCFCHFSAFTWVWRFWTHIAFHGSDGYDGMHICDVSLVLMNWVGWLQRSLEYSWMIYISIKCLLSWCDVIPVWDGFDDLDDFMSYIRLMILKICCIWCFDGLD